MVKVPVESLTDLKTCSTETITEEADADGVADVDKTSPLTETTGSNMSSLSELRENFKFVPADCSKLAAVLRHGAGKSLLTLAALLAAGLLGAPGLAAAQATAQAKALAAPVILIVGDSLSAEYGLKRGTGWVPLLEKQLASEKKAARVVNASISGDTTSGGRSRLPALLAQHKPSAVVIELGGNDALRGLPLEMSEKNLSAMAQAAKNSGAKVLLVGMQVPPNYGAAYAASFAGLFASVAKAEKVALVPFFLKDIGDTDDPTANFQPDRIHPNEQSQARMLANVWPELKKLVK